MNSVAPLLAIFLQCTALFAAEPPEITTRFEVSIDGEKHVVKARADKLKIGGKEHAISVRPMETKTFEDEYISFEVPSELLVDRESEPEYASWDFNGDDIYVGLFRAPKADSREFTENYTGALLEQYSTEDKIRTNRTSLELGSEKIAGTRVEPKFGGQVIVQEVFALESRGQWYVLLLQDAEEEQTAEMKKFRTLLKKTFRRKSAPVETSKAKESAQ